MLTDRNGQLADLKQKQTDANKERDIAQAKLADIEKKKLEEDKNYQELAKREREEKEKTVARAKLSVAQQVVRLRAREAGLIDETLAERIPADAAWVGDDWAVKEEQVKAAIEADKVAHPKLYETKPPAPPAAPGSTGPIVPPPPPGAPTTGPDFAKMTHKELDDYRRDVLKRAAAVGAAGGTIVRP
jgi:hypothetical protein